MMDVQGENRANQLVQLLHLTGVINSDLQLNSVLRSIIGAAMDITESEAASVFLVSPNRNKLILTMPAGPTEETLSGVSFPRTEGIAGWVATHGEAQIVNDVEKDERFRGDFEPEIFKTKNLMSVPLFDQSKKIIGVLQTVNKKEGKNYRDGEIPVFQALANQAAVAIGNAKLNEDREKLLGEVHHRVKNNMAVISAFMQIEAMGEQDGQHRLKLLKNVARITGMSVVHEQLYKSESFTDVNFIENTRQIFSKTLETLETDANTDFESTSDSMVLNINQAIPCSLLMVEIIMFIATGVTGGSGPLSIRVWMEENEQNRSVEIKFFYSDVGGDGEPEILSHQLTQMLMEQCGASATFEREDVDVVIWLRLEKSEMRGSGNYAL